LSTTEITPDPPPDRENNRSGKAVTSAEATVAIAIQLCGPISYFAVVLLVSRLHGASAQGQFAELKVWIDLVIAFGALGLPQSLTYAINRLGADGTELAVLSTKFTLVLVVPLAICSLLLREISGLPFGDSLSLVFVTLAGCVAILVTMLRSILLAYTDGVMFSGSIALQPFVLFLIVLLWTFAGHVPRFDAAMLASFCLALVVVAFMLHSFGVMKSTRRRNAQGVRLKVLFGFGMHAFAQNASVALVPMISIWLIRRSGGSIEDVGVWSIAAAVFQAVASPLAMVAPMLFSRWTAASADTTVLQSSDLSNRALRLSLLPTCILVAGAWFLVPIVFGSAFADAAFASAVLAASLPFIVVSRIMAPAIFASGAPHVLTALLGLRLVVVVVTASTLIWLELTNLFVSLSLSWTLAEVLLAMGSVLWRRQAAPLKRK